MRERNAWMVPLSFADFGSEVVIRRVSGLPEMRKHLEDLGFVAGSTVSVISATDSGFIVKIRESRIAVSREMALKIMV